MCAAPISPPPLPPFSPQLTDATFLSRLRPDQARAQVRALDLQYQLDREALEGRYMVARAALEGIIGGAGVGREPVGRGGDQRG